MDNDKEEINLSKFLKFEKIPGLKEQQVLLLGNDGKEIVIFSGPEWLCQLVYENAHKILTELVESFTKVTQKANEQEINEVILNLTKGSAVPESSPQQ